MKTTRSYFVFIFVFLISCSILFEWNENGYSVQNNSFASSIIDIYDEVFTQKNNITLKIKSSFSFSKEITFFRNDAFVINTSFTCKLKKHTLFSCKIRSFLHLLQLF